MDRLTLGESSSDAPLAPDLDLGFSAKPIEAQTTECTICLSENEAIRLRCGHAFCSGCLKRCATHDIARCPPGPHKGASIVLQIECLAIECVRKSVHPSRT